MSQYALPLSLDPVFSADNFYVSDCNREAFRWIEAWPAWPSHAFLLSGPSGSGKSHLGQLWAARAQAQIIESSQWAMEASRLPRALLLDDIEQVRQERDLLHLLNLTKETKSALLLTARQPASQWEVALPDLASRLRALPAAHIAAPDDEALLGTMRKQFADRQLKVDEDVLAYLGARMERSFAGVALLVDRLDRQALSQKKTLTIPFVRQTLGY